jgi:hypothetical protein
VTIHNKASVFPDERQGPLFIFAQMVTDYLPAMAEGIQTIDNPAALVYVCQTNSDPSTKELSPMTWTSGYIYESFKII